jgi:hypothetical protein
MNMELGAGARYVETRKMERKRFTKVVSPRKHAGRGRNDPTVRPQ